MDHVSHFMDHYIVSNDLSALIMFCLNATLPIFHANPGKP
jgi:hypothetical protein